MSEETTREVIYRNAEPLSIEVARGQRGGYGWTIKFYGRDATAMIEELARIDEQLKQRFGTE